MSTNSRDRRQTASQSAYLTICVGLVVTFSFDLLTSKSNQIIFVPSCTKIIKFGKILPTNVLYDIVLTNFQYAH